MRAMLSAIASDSESDWLIASPSSLMRFFRLSSTCVGPPGVFTSRPETVSETGREVPKLCGGVCGSAGFRFHKPRKAVAHFQSNKGRSFDLGAANWFLAGALQLPHNRLDAATGMKVRFRGAKCWFRHARQAPMGCSRLK